MSDGKAKSWVGTCGNCRWFQSYGRRQPDGLCPIRSDTMQKDDIVCLPVKHLNKAIEEQARHEIQLALARHDPAEMARLGLSMDGDANRDLTARMLLVNVLEHNRVGFRNPSFTPLPKKLKEQIQELLGDY